MDDGRWTMDDRPYPRDDDSNAYFERTDTGILKRFVARPPAASRCAIVLDRDGVINRRVIGGYVTQWSEFRFLFGALAGLVSIAERPEAIIVASNQAAVGKGLMSVNALGEITDRFVSTVQRAGGRIDAVYYCPHTPADECACRKPRPGLLLEAQRDWRLDLGRSVFLGDSETDMAAGRAAGCEVMLAPEATSLDAAWRRLVDRA
jgi:histidinol-phosphate phosphatase family protein